MICVSTDEQMSSVFTEVVNPVVEKAMTKSIVGPYFLTTTR